MVIDVYYGGFLDPVDFRGHIYLCRKLDVGCGLHAWLVGLIKAEKLDQE